MGLCASSLGPVPDAASIYDLPALPDIDGKPVDFAQLKGKDFRLLLEAYASRGLVIIACPCNQFLNQEPGSPEAVKTFLRSRRFNGIIMGKANVNGRQSSPLIAYLKMASGDTSPLPWNYTKFLVGRDGRVYGRFLPRTRPAELEPSIRCLLAEGEEQTAAVPRSASGSTVRAPEHGGMVGVLVDGIGREVKEFLLHPKEDELLPSQRKAAAAAAAAPATGGSDQLSAEPAAAGAAAGPPIGASAATLAAAARPAQAAGQAAEQREHLPVLERVMREAPGEASKC
ncbi:hypothetical protein COHA_007482 [Chlorella ohadii]|uniref:Glutathione peroxidase n=1 Tax=Chlorella ohadii TaxID=2649997 RepID=A0AAD5DMY3_9CHLO|nr:hypothetical protein COHA_007482 [Chlorella ohadii]